MSSCSLVDCKECQANIPEELSKIGEGDFKEYKRFMQKHPDPEFICCVRNRGINSVNYSTRSYVLGCEDLEIIKDFFGYSLSQDTKDEFLNSYWTSSKDNIIQFLIDEGAKLERSNYCDSSFLPSLKKMNKLGYDMNYVNPKTGRNLFLDYSMMGYENKKFKGGALAVECLKYLKSIGVDTKLKDAEGKTALEIASDSTIIAYLKSI